MSDKMTFPKLAEKIAERTGAEKGTIISLLEETTNQIRQSLTESGSSQIMGLGKFRLKWQNERKGRNPQTGETIEIPAHNRIMFTPDKPVREFINREYAHLKPRILEDKSDTAKDELFAAPISTKESAPKPEAPAEKVSEPTHEPVKPAPPQKAEKQKSGNTWIWIAAAAVVIILLIIFFPFGGGTTSEEVSKTTDQTQVQAAEQKSAKENSAAEVNKVEKIEKVESAAEQTPESKTPTKAAKIVAEENINSLDNLSGIAKKYFTTAKFWPLLVTVNSDAIDNPDDLNEKVLLEIPDFKSSFDKLTPAEKHQLATGFLDTYSKYKALGKPKAVGYLWVATQIGNGSLIEKYKSKIDQADLDRAKSMSGKLFWK